MQKLINLRTQLLSINIYAQKCCTCIFFFVQYRGNFRTSTQYFRPNFCTSTHAAAPSVVYLYVAKKLLQWEHKRCIFTEYCPVIYTSADLKLPKRWFEAAFLWNQFIKSKSWCQRFVICHQCLRYELLNSIASAEFKGSLMKILNAKLYFLNCQENTQIFICKTSKERNLKKFGKDK